MGVTLTGVIQGAGAVDRFVSAAISNTALAIKGVGAANADGVRSSAESIPFDVTMCEMLPQKNIGRWSGSRQVVGLGGTSIVVDKDMLCTNTTELRGAVFLKSHIRLATRRWAMLNWDLRDSGGVVPVPLPAFLNSHLLNSGLPYLGAPILGQPVVTRPLASRSFGLFGCSLCGMPESGCGAHRL